MTWHDVIWCDLYNMIWYDICTMWYDMICYDMMWYDIDMKWYDKLWHDIKWLYLVQYDRIRYTMTVE